MDILLKELYNNVAVKSILKKESKLGNLSLSEEALIVASAFQKQPQTMLIVKNNTYTAQRLYECLYSLLGEKVLFFGVIPIHRFPMSHADQLRSFELNGFVASA